MTPAASGTRAHPSASPLDAATEGERRSRRIAIGMMCATTVFYTATDSSAKWLGLHDVPIVEIIWARYAGATLLALIIANPIAAPHLLRSERLGLQALRSLLLLASTGASFMALRTLQLAEANAINFALPLAVALVGGLVLGEWVGPRRLVAIAFGFVGVLVVVQPWTGHIKPAMLLCIANVFIGAGYNVLTRIVAQRDAARTTLVYSTLFGTLALTPIVPTVWTTPASAGVWAVLLAIGLFGALAHLLLILAHARAPAAILAPFSYTQLFWATLSGYVVFGNVPGPATVLGAAIVVLSGLYLWHRERGDRRLSPVQASPRP